MLRELRGVGSAVVLTGAGVSTASGIPDFRGPGGIYSKVSPEVFDIDFFMSHPERYYRIEREILREALNAKPNVTHFLIAKLERMGLIEAVITQNIDGLHRKAGSSKVIELHGNISTGSCLRCGVSEGGDRQDAAGCGCDEMRVWGRYKTGCGFLRRDVTSPGAKRRYAAGGRIGSNGGYGLLPGGTPRRNLALHNRPQRGQTHHRQQRRDSLGLSGLQEIRRRSRGIL